MSNDLVSPSKTIIADCERDVDFITTVGCILITLTTRDSTSGPFGIGPDAVAEVFELQDKGRSKYGSLAAKPLRLSFDSRGGFQIFLKIGNLLSRQYLTLATQPVIFNIPSVVATPETIFS